MSLPCCWRCLCAASSRRPSSEWGFDSSVLDPEVHATGTCQSLIMPQKQQQDLLYPIRFINSETSQYDVACTYGVDSSWSLTARSWQVGFSVLLMQAPHTDQLQDHLTILQPQICPSSLPSLCHFCYCRRGRIVFLAFFVLATQCLMWSAHEVSRRLSLRQQQQ